jgi:hypothetical protein
MGYVLLEQETGIQQCRYPRRERLSGMVGIHTAESVMDDIGIDTGAENVASFIVRRGDYGSYHEIVDADSVVQMAPDNYETWHIAADAHNWHSWGISAACAAHEWDPDKWWTRQTINRMGERICAFWRRNGWDPLVSARWLNIDQAHNRLIGLVHHGVAQPADRSDAWVNHPRRPELDRMLIQAIHRAANGGVSEDDDTMANVEEVADKVVDKMAPMLTRVVNKAVDDGVRNLADNWQGTMPNSLLQVRADLVGLSGQGDDAAAALVAIAEQLVALAAQIDAPAK